jgi:hypothetical protein
MPRPRSSSAPKEELTIPGEIKEALLTDGAVRRFDGRWSRGFFDQPTLEALLSAGLLKLNQRHGMDFLVLTHDDSGPPVPREAPARREAPKSRASEKRERLRLLRKAKALLTHLIQEESSMEVALAAQFLSAADQAALPPLFISLANEIENPADYRD